MKQHPLYAQIQSLKAERAAYLAAREQAAA